ncbi:SURF1 family protein [Algiphilus sp.]|uniref:SURF1 family protein n=1 Tax=Algiphilus sp. TaxID=1872431 RepID=UPI003B5172F6
MPERRSSSGLRAFRPPLWAWVLTPAVMAVMVSLGFWQLDRAAEKQQLQADFHAAMQQAPQAMPVPAPAATTAPAHVVVRGRFLQEKQFLLDSQIQDGQAGVRVWTALQRDEGGIILVDRGWIEDPGRDTATQWPIDGAERDVQGLWRPLPAAGLSVSNRVCAENGPPTPRVQYPTHAQLTCAFEGRLADGLLLLHPAEPDGFQRDWAPDYLRPEVHWGYAVQWFAFAIALLVIFIVVNWKKR